MQDKLKRIMLREMEREKDKKLTKMIKNSLTSRNWSNKLIIFIKNIAEEISIRYNNNIDDYVDIMRGIVWRAVND